jgi:hypothetical protein
VAIAGTWKAGAVTPSEYTGAARWGTGINPIHAVRDGTGRPTATKEPLIAGDPQTDMVPEDIIGPSLWGYSAEDAAYYAGEDYRYLLEDHPNWGDNETGRADRDGDIMTEGLYPQPEGFPAWGPYNDDNPMDGFPISGPPGGAGIRSYSDGAAVEFNHSIAVPTPGWRGGWRNKAHGQVQEAEGSAPSQYEITTSMTQLHQTRVNTAATVRGTDDPRAPIESRLTGQKIKDYAKSSGMGGGPGTPDMKPVTQALPYRPWFFRTAGLPPPPDTTYGTMTGFEPIERTVPVDAGEYVVTQEAAPAAAGEPDPDFGYSSEDTSYGY